MTKVFRKNHSPIDSIEKTPRTLLTNELPIVFNIQEVAEIARFWVTETRLEYYGYCAECKDTLSLRSW
jgi:hypothetical protein